MTHGKVAPWWEHPKSAPWDISSRIMMGTPVHPLEGKHADLRPHQPPLNASRFTPDEAVWVATDSIYVRKSARKRLEWVEAFIPMKKMRLHLLFFFLTDGAHELAPRVNLEELRPPQGARLVNPSKAIGDLCHSLASQGLSLFIAAGDVNDRESITEGFLSLAVVWQEEQVCLRDLVWYRHVKFRPWYVSWSRQIDLPDGLLFEPVLGLLLSHLCCRRQLFDGCGPLRVTSGTVVNA